MFRNDEDGVWSQLDSAHPIPCLGGLQGRCIAHGAVDVPDRAELLAREMLRRASAEILQTGAQRRVG